MSEFEPMKPEIRDLWVNALLSGEYRRNRHRLKDPDGSYCPLGVLCELYRQQTGVGEWGERPSLKNGLAFIVPPGHHQFVWPHHLVLSWAGISDALLDRNGDTIKGIISGKNDSNKLDFDGMGEWIKNNL